MTGFKRLECALPAGRSEASSRVRVHLPWFSKISRLGKGVGCRSPREEAEQHVEQGQSEAGVRNDPFVYSVCECILVGAEIV